jgi:hypothetical protein
MEPVAHIQGRPDLRDQYQAGPTSVTRHLIILHTASDRERAMKYIRLAPPGTRVELKAAKRSLAQNEAMWAALSDVSAQAVHNGRKYTPDTWKLIFLQAIGKEFEFAPTLDGKDFIPFGMSSSDLSREDMTALLDFIQMWCAEQNITLHHPAEEAVA